MVNGRVESAVDQEQQFFHLFCHQCDNLFGCASVGEHFGGDVEAERLVVGGSVVGAGLTAPDGDLADEDAHHRQEHGDLDVGALDGEPLVGPGEEEVEPHPGGEAGDQGRYSPPGQGRQSDRYHHGQGEVVMGTWLRRGTMTAAAASDRGVLATRDSYGQILAH